MEKKQIDLKKVQIDKATLADADAVFSIVSAAYIIEVGNTGIQFKKKNRYLGVEQALKEIKDSIDIPDGFNQPQILYLVARYEGEVIASIRGCIEIAEDGAKVCECGPIAVSPKFQGSGLGNLIIETCEDLAVREY